MPAAARCSTLAEEVAREAGRLIVDERPRGPRGRRDQDARATDIVTEMDQRVRAAARRPASRAARPDDGFLGEEGAARAGTSGVTWVIDPIDGTVNYLYEHPGVRGQRRRPGRRRGRRRCRRQPRSAARSGPRLRGDGAWLDGRRAPLARAAGAGAWRWSPPASATTPRRRAAQAEVLAGVLPQVRDVRRVGCGRRSTCARSRRGRVDGYYEQGLKPWDLAAGGLVAAEAGAVVTGLHGRAAGEALVVAARAAAGGQLVALLEALDADRDPLA